METIQSQNTEQEEEPKRVMAKITHPVYQAIRVQKSRKKRKYEGEE